MSKKPLTAKTLQHLKEPGRHPDGTIPGLYCKVANGGSKSFMLRISVAGRRRDIGLGGFPATSLAEARELAREYHAVARKGGDPIAERNKSPALTFTEASHIVHQTQILTSTKNAKHQNQWINTLRDYAFPVIGNMTVDAVGSAEILQVLTPIWTEKPETARRVRQRLQKVFAWTIQAGHRAAANPVENVSTALPKQRDKVQHFSAMPWREVPAFMAELQNRSAVSARALAFLIYNACRTGEVIGATWDEIDFAKALWTVPASRMKNGEAHRKPLTKASLEILEAMRGLDDTYIFPSTKPNKPLSNMAMLTLLRRMKRTDITCHGFRTSFRVFVAEETDIPREIAELCLAHDVRGEVERAYSRTDHLEKRREVVDIWSNIIAH